MSVLRIWLMLGLGLNLIQRSSSQEEIPSWDAQLHLHPADTIAKFNAVCLDGTPGGFYYRPASTAAGRNKWKFHFQGGGWCFTAEDCVSRSKGLLGSSKTWTQSLSAFWGNTAGFYGLMSANTTDVNPFGDWNFVWLAYCDGTSQTSDVTDPVKVNAETIHFRGRALLDAHMFELERQYKFLSTATEVIVSGTSAGGLSTYVQSSFIRSQLQTPGAKLVAVPDAGWWWNHTQYNNPAKLPWVDSVQSGLAIWNATLRGTGAKCLRDMSLQGTVDKCFTQPYAYAYLDVPTFVVQSIADPANLGFCYKMPCALKGNSNGSCTQNEITAIEAYGQELKQSILTAQTKFPSRDSHFITSCQQHEETCREFDWYGITINGQTMNSTFHTWYTEGTTAAGASAIDSVWPNDATCTYTKGAHGSC